MGLRGQLKLNLLGEVSASINGLELDLLNPNWQLLVQAIATPTFCISNI